MISIIDYSKVSAKDLPKRDPSKEECIARIMAGLHCTAEEAEAVYAYDKALDSGERLEFDLPPEKEEIARKMAHTGTRDRKEPGKPQKRERKPNATKGGVVAEIAKFLEENSEFEINYLQIPNKEGKISFMIGDKWYTWTLTEHRKKPTWANQV